MQNNQVHKDVLTKLKMSKKKKKFFSKMNTICMVKN